MPMPNDRETVVGRRSPVAQRLLAVAAVLVIVGGLRLGQDLFVPLALALLFSFLLAPLADRLERFHLGRVWAVLLVVALAFCVAVGIGWVVMQQAFDLAGKMPEYRDEMRRKRETLFNSRGMNSMKTQFAAMQAELSEVAPTTATTPTEAAQGESLLTKMEARATVGRRTPRESRTAAENAEAAKPQPTPLPVRVVEPPPDPLRLARLALGPLLAPLGTLAVITVLVIFILLRREDLRDRLIRLGGEHRLHQTTQAIDDVSRRLSRYLLMQLTINASYGIPVVLVLSLIGLPNALLWGVLCMLLRFIPYVGPWVAAAMPTLLSLAVFDGWGHFMIVVGMFVTLEVISNNILEPVLYSQSTGASTVALLVAATFWTWLWGGIGLVLSTPLTVCLVTLGKYVPQLSVFNILLGDDPVLTPPIRIYQRVLADNRQEVKRLLVRESEERGLPAACETLLYPALELAERDFSAGLLEPDRLERVHTLLLAVFDETAQTHAPKLATEFAAPSDTNGAGRNSGKADEDEAAPQAVTLDWPVHLAALQHARIRCVAARSAGDHAAGAMLIRLLQEVHFQADLEPLETLTGELPERLAADGINMVIVSGIYPFAASHVRFLCKRLRSAMPQMRLLVVLWGAGDAATARELIGEDCGDRAATGLLAALEQVQGQAVDLSIQPESAAVVPH